VRAECAIGGRRGLARRVRMARALHPNRVSIQHPGAAMREMAGADAFFLYEETPARHMHTMKIIEVDPSTSQQPLTMERVRQGAALVMPTRRAFRVRPVPIPFGLGHPFWADAPRLDRDYHFRHVLLEAPGGRDEFDALVSRVASTPLARDRPLWQLYFVEGLAGGRAAYMVKIHHAVADGIASAHLVASSFDTAADARYDLASLVGAVNESVPRSRALLAAALRREIGRQREAAGGPRDRWPGRRSRPPPSCRRGERRERSPP